MGWGNAIMRKVHKDASGAVTAIDAGAAQHWHGGWGAEAAVWLARQAAVQLAVGLHYALLIAQLDVASGAPTRCSASNSNAVCTNLGAELNLEGDFKKTKLKLTWLAQSDECPQLDLVVSAGCRSYL